MATIGDIPTWQTACYQRQKVMDKYIQSKRLIELLSLSALE